MKRVRIVLSCMSVLMILAGVAFGQEASTSQPAARATFNESGERHRRVTTTAPSGEAAESESPPTSQPTSQPAEAEKLSVSLKGMEVEKVAAFLGEQMGKPVLVAEEVRQKKITIVCKAQLPKAAALRLIREALLGEGLVVETTPDFLRIRPVGEIMQTQLPQLGPDESAMSIDDTLQIATKEFNIVHCDIKQLVTVIEPMKSSFAGIVANPNTHKLYVTDMVVNLRRIELVIAGMDTPMAEGTVTDIIKVVHGDASEIISIVRYLIAGRMGLHVKDVTVISGAGGAKPGGGGSSSSRGRSSSRDPRMAMMRGGRSSGRSSSSGATPPRAAGPSVTTIEASKTAVTLVPNVSRNWIIAVAPAPVMEQIKALVFDLDKPRTDQKVYELVPIKHADVDDIARQVERTILQMPNPELREATHVVPFGQAKQVIVFGSPAGRMIVKELLGELDVVDATKRIRQSFELEHADATEMATRIESLFSSLDVAYKSSYYTAYQRNDEAPKVTVVADPRRNTITVVTEPDVMAEIAELILEEDIAITVAEAMPKIYELHYVDPGEVKTLLSSMFGATQQRQRSFWDMYYGRNDNQRKPVGRLLGQFAFEVMPSSNRLIVTAKNPAHFGVIDEIIAKLDTVQTVGVPEIVPLNYANAEDVAEQLNAMLAKPSTLARIQRAQRGLTEYQRASTSSNEQNSNNTQNRNQNRNQEEAGQMTFWWQNYRPPTGEVPTSNLIGKIRIVPVYRRNALMVMASGGYRDPIMQLIKDLDEPGKQVMIATRIGEISHESQTSLGLRIATDPGLLGVGDTAILGATAAAYEGVVGSTLTLNSKISVAAMLNMLMREFDMKILLEPTLTTSDNEAAQFFDGQDVPTTDESRTSSEGTSTVTATEYRAVGTLLRVRPHITVDGNVDLIVNLEISRIVPGTELLDNPTIDRREVTTHVVVKDGQTIMLSGIIRQDDFEEVRKLPILGDLPWIGKAFRSIDKGTRNRELVIFLTPHVMGANAELEAQMRRPHATMKRVEVLLNGDAPTAEANLAGQIGTIEGTE